MFALTGDAPAAADLFVHAATLLGGRDPRVLVRAGSDAALHGNRVGQILCTVQALAATAALQGSLCARRIVAGYSVGEVAAWGVAGAIEPAATLDVVAGRADAMDGASSPGDGMLFVRGLRRTVVDELCLRHGAGIAIVEPGGAFIVGGDRAGLDAIAREARALHAARIVDVAVNVASHTSRLAPAATIFREQLRKVAATPPSPGTRLLSGIDGTSVVDAETGLDKLASQISHTVQWAACLESCVEGGTTAFLELGPGRALAEMAGNAYSGIEARSVEDFRTLDGISAWAERVGGTRTG